MTLIDKIMGSELPGELLVSRKAHPENTIVDIPLPDKSGHLSLGDGSCPVIAGPCTLESREQVFETASMVLDGKTPIFRGGAYKSRTSPYDYSGMREDGIEILEEIRSTFNVPVVSEILSPSHLPLFENIDILQVGERNMRNAELLRELGKIDKPVLLKRSHSATIKELLLSAEYILAGGNGKVILCERGIRTFETMTRNTMDISAIPLLKELSHLPVIADPSHATGIASLVCPMSMAAAAAGADGLIIEVHHDPASALCDGAQALLPAEFHKLTEALEELLKIR